MAETYSKEGSFPGFLKQTNEKRITLSALTSQLKDKYQFNKREEFIFTDIGAGEGTLTKPIISFLRKKFKLKAYCIEPSNLIDVLKRKCGKDVIYIKRGMEETKIPHSHFILIAHALNHLKDRKEFARKIANSLLPEGKMLVIGTHPKSDDLQFRRELRPNKNKINKKGDLFEYLEELGFKINRHYVDAEINLNSAMKLNKEGRPVISFYFRKPFKQISQEELNKFIETSKRYALRGKLKKTLQFIWVEK